VDTSARDPRAADGEARIALFGGSFNPPHVGHVLVTAYVLATRPVDAVWLVPVFSHPFGKDVAPYTERLAMTQLVADCLGPRVLVSDVEGHLGGESRTVNTLRHLHQQHPATRWSLVVGADILKERHAWYGWDEITRLAEIVVVGREGGPEPESPTVAMPNVSSTEVRARLADGRPVSHLVPAAVLAHIRSRGLYGAARNDDEEVA